MTDYSDFTASLADFANRQDWSPILLASFVRAAEQKLNAELRIDRMIQTSQNIVTQRCALLPDDYLEADFVRIASAVNDSGWQPIRYKPRDEFFALPDVPYSSSYDPSSNSTTGFYTIEGRTIYFGGPPDAVNGLTFLMDYYAEVPVFSDTQPSWVYTKFPQLYRNCALIDADLHAVGEEDKANMLKQLAEDTIQKLNAAHRFARASGSRLSRARVRSFG